MFENILTNISIAGLSLIGACTIINKIGVYLHTVNIINRKNNYGTKNFKYTSANHIVLLQLQSEYTSLCYSLELIYIKTKECFLFYILNFPNNNSNTNIEYVEKKKDSIEYDALSEESFGEENFSEESISA